jgi:hypothetical protein
LGVLLRMAVEWEVITRFPCTTRLLRTASTAASFYDHADVLFAPDTRGAPARAIQELAGHHALQTTQRYMHLSPAALDAAIRLLDEPGPGLGPAKAGPHDSHGEIVGSRGR